METQMIYRMIYRMVAGMVYPEYYIGNRQTKII